MMKHMSWHMGLEWIIALVFACLFLSGVQRLISVESSSDLNTDEWICQEARICGIVELSHDRQTGYQKNNEFDGKTISIVYLKSNYIKDELLYTDANGNILSSRCSYLRAVYRAFPLGDGFA